MEASFNKIDSEDSSFGKIINISCKKSILIEVNESEDDNFYNVYIKNNSHKTIEFFPQLYYLEIIQEALNREGEWKPIEFYKYDGHGWADVKIDLPQNGILKSQAKKISGNFKTKIRFKLLVNEKNYYSKPFDGQIDEKHFKLPSEKDLENYHVFNLLKKYDEKLAWDVIFLKAGSWKKINKKIK